MVVGDSLVAFFREYKNSGLTPEQMPVMSMCVGEEEVRSIGAATLTGQLSSWNYYQTLDSPPANTKFVADFKARFGAERVTSDPMESAYAAVLLWKASVEKANSFGVPDIQKGRGRRQSRRARGQGHDRRRESPRHQDGADRPGGSRRADLPGVGVPPAADRAGSVPAQLPVGGGGDHGLTSCT